MVSGNLPSTDGKYSLYCAVIVKKVDAQTRAKTSINELLRATEPQSANSTRSADMILDKLFQLMAEKQASDIFISAGAPIHIKIQGNTMPVNQQTMLPDMVEKIAFELMSPDQTQAFDEHDGDEPLLRRPQRRQLPRQYVPPARRRSRSSSVIILGNIPQLDALDLPPVLGRPDHGEARPGADRRRHRLGQVDHPRVDARSPQQQPHPATS